MRMEVWEGPTDLLGIGLYHSIVSKMEEDSDYRQFINDLEMNIVLDLGFYPVMIKFRKDSLEFTTDITEKSDATLKIAVQDLFNLIDGTSSIFGLFLKRKLKVKPFLKLLKIYKIFSKGFK